MFAAPYLYILVLDAGGAQLGGAGSCLEALGVVRRRWELFGGAWSFGGVVYLGWSPVKRPSSRHHSDGTVTDLCRMRGEFLAVYILAVCVFEFLILLSAECNH